MKFKSLSQSRQIVTMWAFSCRLNIDNITLCRKFEQVDLTREGGTVADLTVKHQLFVDSFMGEAKGNATQAARLAGYSDPNAASGHVLKVPAVRAAIDEIMASRVMSRDEVLDRLTAIARADLTGFFSKDPTTGKMVVDVDKAFASGDFALVEEVGWTEHGPKVKLPSKLEALKILGRFHGLLREEIDLNVRNNDGDQIRAELIRKLQNAQEKDALAKRGHTLELEPPDDDGQDNESDEDDD